MTSRIPNTQQGTEEWLLARLGKVTASKVYDICAVTQKGTYTAARDKYKLQLIAERLTGTPTQIIKSLPMQWGTLAEPLAKLEYEKLTYLMRDEHQLQDHKDAARSEYATSNKVEVVDVGLIDHPTIHMAAASPDGLVGVDGLIEIKNPNTSTHIQYLMDDYIPDVYMHQMYWQMSVTNRQWCDFFSFDPRITNAKWRVFKKRVPRDNDKIAQIEQQVIKFLAEITEILNAR